MSLVFDAIAKGVGIGILLAVLVGPVFFALLQTSLQKGFWNGLAIALGILVSDAFYIFLAFWGISGLIREFHLNFVLGLTGGAFLIGFGINLWSKKRKYYQVKPVKKTSFFATFIKGFLLNALNPFVLIYWIGVIGGIGARYDYQAAYLVPFMVACLSTVFSTDLIKVYFSTRIKRVLNAHVLRILNRLTGTGFMLFGAYLIWYSITHF